MDMLPLRDYLAAISAGLVDGEAHLDLDYREDAAASVDLNVIMKGSGEMVEIQGTAEKGSFDRQDLDRLLDLAASGIISLIEKQREALGETAVRLIDSAREKSVLQGGD